MKNTKQHSGELAKKIGFAVFMVLLGSVLVCVAIQNISVMLAL